jgi:dipeptidyl-peptidase-4
MPRAAGHKRAGRSDPDGGAAPTRIRVCQARNFSHGSLQSGAISISPVMYRILLLFLALQPFVMLAADGNKPVPPRVYRAQVIPHWFAGNTRFWYRNDLAGDAHEFIVVDAEKGTRKAAFDHQRVAAALAKISGNAVTADHLPVLSLEFDQGGESVALHGIGASWRLVFATYELSAGPKPVDVVGDLNPRPSSRTGPSTDIVFINSLAEDLDIYWIAPDGSRHAYGSVAARQRRPQQTYAGHVWVVTKHDGTIVGVYEAAEEGTQALITSRGLKAGATPTDDAPKFVADEPEAAKSPDGKSEAFIRDNNLWVRNLESSAEFQISTDGTPGDTYHLDFSREREIDADYTKQDAKPTLPDVRWSPDSKHLVAMRTHLVQERRVSLIESSPSDQVQPKLESYPYLKAGDEIPISIPHLFAVDSRRQIPISNELFPMPWSTDNVAWDPNSSQFGFLYNQRGHQILRLIAVDAQTGVARTVVNEQSDTFIDYTQGVFMNYLENTDELVWMSERDGWRHLYLYDVKTGLVKNQITRGDWVVDQVLKVDSERRQIWFLAGGIRPKGEPYYIDLCRVNLDGSGLVILTEGAGTHSVKMSPDRRFFIDTWSRADLPPVSVLRLSESGKLICRLEKADASEILASRGRFPERFVAKGRDGTTDIYGVIYRPKSFRSGSSYPVIESIYAGPQGFHVPKTFQGFYREEVLADSGSIVVQIDGMGTAGRSKKFHDVCWKNLADAGFPDRISWIRAAAARHPEMDLKRIGIYGTSAGGQSAMAALLWHGDFYKVGVADSGCHDNRMDKIWWSEQWMGWPVGPQYAGNSNVTHAAMLQGKLMLLVGELDKNVDPASTMQVVNALVKANKDFELIVVPGAGHGVLGTPYGWRRMKEFFAKNLSMESNPAA